MYRLRACCRLLVICVLSLVPTDFDTWLLLGQQRQDLTAQLSDLNAGIQVANKQLETLEKTVANVDNKLQRNADDIAILQNKVTSLDTTIMVSSAILGTIGLLVGGIVIRNLRDISSIGASTNSEIGALRRDVDRILEGSSIGTHPAVASATAEQTGGAAQAKPPRSKQSSAGSGP